MRPWVDKLLMSEDARTNVASWTCYRESNTEGHEGAPEKNNKEEEEEIEFNERDVAEGKSIA